VLLHYQGYDPEGGPFWLDADSPRLWLGSYKDKDWKYLVRGLAVVVERERARRLAVVEKGAGCCVAVLRIIVADSNPSGNATQHNTGSRRLGPKGLGASA